MYFSAPIDRLYTPLVACWWLGMMTCLHMWAGMAGSVEPPRRHLRLVTDRGRLVEYS
jgi:hypothetical protein